MKFLFCLSGLLIFFIMFPSRIYAAGKSPYKVFIVHSYSLENICGLPQQLGVLESLKKNNFIPGKNINLSILAMDTKLKNNTPELIEEQARLAIGKIDSVSPDILIVLDDNAFRTVALHYLDSDMPVVFSGMNVQPENYNKIKPWMDSRIRPGHNITGVYEKLHIVDALVVEKRLIPGLEKVVMVYETSPTGLAVFEQVKAELAAGDPGVELELKVAGSWEQYKKIIKSICNEPAVGGIYPVAALLKDSKGNSYGSEKIIHWTVKNCMKPGIPLNYSWARLGLMGGCGVDFISMGRQAGDIAARILKGASPKDIPIEDARRYALVINLKRARELGIVIPDDILMAADEVYE